MLPILSAFPDLRTVQISRLSTKATSEPRWPLHTIGARPLKQLAWHLNALRSFFLRFTKKIGAGPRINPAEQIVIPKVGTLLPKVPTVAQTETLLAGVTNMARIGVRPEVERDCLILEFLYGAGLRVSELIGLNLEDIDFEECWLLIRGKGKKERQVPFGSKAKAALAAYLRKRGVRPGENALIVGPRGTRLSVRAISRIVKKYASGVLGDSTIHAHSLRHAYATDLLNNGADLRSVQELLGHACLSTTQLYTRVSPGHLVAVYDAAHPKGQSGLNGASPPSLAWGRLGGRKRLQDDLRAVPA